MGRYTCTKQKRKIVSFFTVPGFILSVSPWLHLLLCTIMRRFTKEIILFGILLLFLPVSDCQDDDDDVEEAPVAKIDDGQSRGKKLTEDIVLSVRSWLPGKVKEQLEEAKRDNVTVQVTLVMLH